MSVVVNGAPDETAAGRTLTDLLLEQTGSLRGSAVVVDGEVVPRGEWDGFRIADGQHVEVITAVQGG